MSYIFHEFYAREHIQCEASLKDFQIIGNKAVIVISGLLVLKLFYSFAFKIKLSLFFSFALAFVIRVISFL